MTDKYDDAVAYLTAHPEEIYDAWYYTSTRKGGCLFAFCSNRKWPGCCGCLVQVRQGDDAQTEALTLAIRADRRIPIDPRDITVDLLPVFAAWQRRIDVELDRK